MTIFLVILAGLAVVVVMAFRGVSKGAAEGDALKAATLASIHNVDGFNPAVVYAGQPGNYGLAIDPATDKFAIMVPGSIPRLYHFTQLVAAEVERNGTTITTTKGKISTGGAALATALAGPVGGLLVGAKTTSTSTTLETIELTLKVFVNDLYTPCFAVPFGSGFAGDSFLADRVSEIDAWYGRFRTILAALEGKRGDGPHADAVVHTGPVAALPKLSFAARSFTLK